MPERDGDASSDFRIFETEEFQRRLSGLPARDARFIQQKLTAYIYPQLRENPFFGPNIGKLRGYQPDIWRYRTGRFRLFYVVDQETRIVSLLSIHDRRDAYR